MRIRFLSPANIELNEAIDYYDHQLPGLGFRFLQEVSSSIERIKILPEAWTKIGIHTRRCIIKGFPYAVLFIMEENTITVTAIAHLHRNPKHFRKRIF